MKNITYLLLLSAAFAGSINAMEKETAVQGDPFDQMIEFKELKKKHKVEWLNFMADSASQKYKLLADHATKTFDFKIAKVKEWKNFTSTDMNARTELKRKNLLEAVKFHDEQAKQMSDFCMKKFEEARKIAQKHKEEMNAFKQKIGIMPAETKEEMKTEKPEETMTAEAAVEVMDIEIPAAQDEPEAEPMIGDMPSA